MYAMSPTGSAKSIQNRGRSIHKRRDPTHTEELVAQAYKYGYRLGFSDRAYVERVQQFIVAWGYELAKSASLRTDQFSVAMCAVPIAVVLGRATTNKLTWDEFLEALREELPSNNLNFSI